jgi:hypothetical protein
LFLKAGRDKDARKIEMLLEQAKINAEKLDEVLKKYGLTRKFSGLKKKRYGR